MRMTSRTSREAELDIIVCGATSFVGRLVAEHLLRRRASGLRIKIGFAGRNYEKLCALREELNAPKDIPLIVTDLYDESSLRTMVRRTKVVVTTVGPYQLYGAPLLKACVSEGTDYLDLCAELIWIRRMIEELEGKAIETGARILFSCGFASLPSELGVLRLQEIAIDTFGSPFPAVSGYVRDFKGGLSGGTAASLNGTEDAMVCDPALAELVRNPFYLCPNAVGSKACDVDGARFDEVIGAWTAPFFLGPIDVANVYRSNLLQGHLYGKEFVYRESILAGEGVAGAGRATALACGPSPLADAYKVGEGPAKDERDSGLFDLLFVGSGMGKSQLHVSLKGNDDPGYGTASRFIAEAAICMLTDTQSINGGMWTAGSALGNRLTKVLEQSRDLVLTVEYADSSNVRVEVQQDVVRSL